MGNVRNIRVKSLPVLMLLLAAIGGPVWPLRSQTNLLVNPGLETNYYSLSTNQIAFGWTNSAHLGASLWLARETNNPHSGTNCQRVVITGLVATNSALFYQPFTFLPGLVYHGSVWLRDAANLPVQFDLRNADNNYQAAASAVVTVGTNWQQFLITGGWQNGTNAQFAVNFLGNGTNWIDDASLTDVTSNYLYAPPQNTTSAVPATFFGLHINKLTAVNNWPPLQQGLVRFWDVSLKWSQVETNTNTFTWTRFDSSTNVVQTNYPGCKVIYTFGGTPLWAALNTNATDANGVTNGSSSEPRNLNDWSNFVQSVVARYKGFINYYELWNETDYKGFYSGSITTMVAMAQIAHGVINNTDPAAKILGPNITLNGLGWLEQFIQAGGQSPDIITFHNYPTNRPESSLGEIAGVRDLLSRYPAWSSLPVWCTEGAPNVGASSMENQGIVARAYLFWWWQNIPNWNWYAWELTNVNNSFQVPLSINPPGENPSPAGIAYSNTVNWLVGARMPGMNVDTNGTWTAALQRLGVTNAHVVWNPDVTANYSIPASWNVFQMRDLSNNVTSLTNLSTITAGLAPVILDSVPSLAISNSIGAKITLLWPTPANGFNLYNATNLSPASWLKITNPLIASNGLMQVSLPNTNRNIFFRLISP